jgi:hypothetical protein
LRQQPGAARVGNQPDLAESLDEAGAWRGDGDIASHHQRSACACGHAVYRAHRGHAQVGDAPRRGVEGLVDHRAGVGAFLQVGAGLKVKLGQISAGAKATACAGEHQGADLRVSLGLVQRGPQVCVHLARKAVERGGAVERYQGYSAPGFVKHGGFGHCLSPTPQFTTKPPLPDRLVG